MNCQEISRPSSVKIRSNPDVTTKDLLLHKTSLPKKKNNGYSLYYQ